MPLRVVLLIACCWVALSKVQAHTHAVDSLDYSLYPYLYLISANEDADVVRITDDDFLNRSGKVVFRVNKFDKFKNDSLLHELEHEVLPLINRDGMKLVRMIFRGAASPEGPFAFNRMLSEKRAQTLVNFLRARIKTPLADSMISIQTVAEDYHLLVAMMEQADDPDVLVVRNLVNHHTPKHQYTLLKTRLQRLQHGRLWKRLLYQYFPKLRAAHLMLFFERPEEPVAEPVMMPAQQAPSAPTGHMQVAEEKQAPMVLPHDTIVTIPRRELLSVKSNLLLDFAYMPGYNRWCPIPNIALEYYPKHGHFTYGASVDFPWWQHYWDHKYFELRNYQLETRYYLRSGDIRKNPPGSGQAFRGFYLQAYAHAGIFLFCFNRDKGWTGEYFGAGLGFGYVMPIAKRWRLEFGLQAGFIAAQYDPFQFEYRGSVDLQDHLYYYDWTLPSAKFKKRQYRYNWIGPTRIGITLSYDLLFRRQTKRGVSLKSYELIRRRVEP